MTSCLSSSFSNRTIHLKQQLAGTENLDLTFDLSNENLNGKRDSYSGNLENLNKTFIVDLGNNNLNESYDAPVPENILYGKINRPILESVCSTENSVCVQLDSEKLGVLNKTINLTTFQPNCMLERNRFSELDSEESFGIIPKALESSCEILNWSPVLNDKENHANEAVMTEVFASCNQKCIDLNKRCLIDLDIPLKGCPNNERYTSTPKQLKNYIDLNSSLMFSQYNHNFLLQEGEKVDEPIIASSTNQIATHLYLDEIQFDRVKVLTSTSKLSLPQIHSPDLLSKTSVINFKDHEMSVFSNNNRNAQRTLKDCVKVSDCGNSETRTLLHNTNILNDTFEAKPASKYSQGVLDENCPSASVNLSQNCTTLNKTISIENSTKMKKKSIKAPNATCLPKPMKTKVYGEMKRSVSACKNSNAVPLKVKTVQHKTKSNDTLKKVSSLSCVRTKVTIKTSLNDTFTKNKVYKGNLNSTCEIINSNTEVNNSSYKNLTLCASESREKINAKFHNHKKFEMPGKIFTYSCKLQTELPVVSVTETVNEENLKQEVTFKSSKGVSEKSNLECKSKNSVSLKGLVKGLFSRNVKLRVSIIPGHKYNTLNETSESKDPCTSKQIEYQGPSRILSKQNSRSIPVPKLKSSSGYSKDVKRHQEKPLQKENCESNSVSMEVKNTVLKAHQSDNGGKICPGERYRKPVTEKAPKVLNSGIPKRSRIPFAAHQKVQTLQSPRIK